MIKGSAGARRRRLITHGLALWVWAFAVWVLLTWTLTAEQLLVGAVIATAVAMVFAPLGPVARPWRLLDPEVLWRLAVLAATALARSVVSNVRLAVRVWSPRRPVRSGMLVVPTKARGPGEVTAVGVLTSLIVDNQLVDLDRHAHRLQYHAVWITTEDPEGNRRHINGPIEDRMRSRHD
ncbi:Na+/H+ antiporter subunit E [Actinopolymorpha pittospori]|uniref:Multicomponent Na+:H+ antiporter subunit E n=1 Tax=Actinopolymorpha pittospori TaxID=648752 RepID=A0A927MU39_9ACTN|nr:multicomponent Na+:H+ antiporter subunit E [Actinopolymorpha pittospori]